MVMPGSNRWRSPHSMLHRAAVGPMPATGGPVPYIIMEGGQSTVVADLETFPVNVTV